MSRLQFLLLFGMIATCLAACDKKTSSTTAAATPASPQEAKKKRMAEIMTEVMGMGPEARNQPAQREKFTKLITEGDMLMKELTGGDKSKEDDVAADALKTYAPDQYNRMMEMRGRAMGVGAASRLKNLSYAANQWRMNDYDRDQINDFWTRDVAGMHYLEFDGRKQECIEEPLAQSDPQIGNWIQGAQPKPAGGYFFCAVLRDESGKPYSDQVLPSHGQGENGHNKYKDTACLNNNKFAFCAYPANYGSPCKMTYIIDEAGLLFQKDTGGKPVEQWPGAEPQKAGWKVMD